MGNGDKTVRRTLHFKFTLTGADPAQLLSMMRAAAPFYELFANARMHLMQNVDDPARFIQIIEYDAPRTLEQNRQEIASDPRVQSYIQAWRAFLQGSLDVDLYQEIEG